MSDITAGSMFKARYKYLNPHHTPCPGCGKPEMAFEHGWADLKDSHFSFWARRSVHDDGVCESIMRIRAWDVVRERDLDGVIDTLREENAKLADVSRKTLDMARWYNKEASGVEGQMAVFVSEIETLLHIVRHISYDLSEAVVRYEIDNCVEVPAVVQSSLAYATCAIGQARGVLGMAEQHFPQIFHNERVAYQDRDRPWANTWRP